MTTLAARAFLVSRSLTAVVGAGDAVVHVVNVAKVRISIVVDVVYLSKQ